MGMPYRASFIPLVLMTFASSYETRTPFSEKDVKLVIAAMKALRQGNTLGKGVSIRDLINGTAATDLPSNSMLGYLPLPRDASRTLKRPGLGSRNEQKSRADHKQQMVRGPHRQFHGLQLIVRDGLKSVRKE
jgi:hypothetical protein